MGVEFIKIATLCDSRPAQSAKLGTLEIEKYF